MKLTPEQIEAQLNEIRQDYLTSLVDKRATLVNSFSALGHAWNQVTYETLYRLLHSLAGSAETFGLSEVTAQARLLLNHFKQHDGEYARGVRSIREADALYARLLASIDASLQETDKPG